VVKQQFFYTEERFALYKSYLDKEIPFSLLYPASSESVDEGLITPRKVVSVERCSDTNYFDVIFE